MVRISNIELIRALMKNSRVKYTKLAELFNVTETAIRKRVRVLEEKGVIKKYTMEVDPRSIGFNVDAFIGLDAEPESYIEVLDFLKNEDKVIDLYSSSGDHMILMRAWFKNYDELMKFVKKLERMKGVTRICPATIIEKIK